MYSHLYHVALLTVGFHFGVLLKIFLTNTLCSRRLNTICFSDFSYWKIQLKPAAFSSQGIRVDFMTIILRILPQNKRHFYFHDLHQLVEKHLFLSK